MIRKEYFAKRDANSIDYSSFYFDYVFFNDYQPETLKRMLSSFGPLQKEGEER